MSNIKSGNKESHGAGSREKKGTYHKKYHKKTKRYKKTLKNNFFS
jgi:hypothetical protein